jgi:hypothetical protein
MSGAVIQFSVTLEMHMKNMVDARILPNPNLAQDPPQPKAPKQVKRQIEREILDLVKAEVMRGWDKHNAMHDEVFIKLSVKPSGQDHPIFNKADAKFSNVLRLTGKQFRQLQVDMNVVYESR